MKLTRLHLVVIASIVTAGCGSADEAESGESAAALESVSSLEATLPGFVFVGSRSGQAFSESPWRVVCAGSGEATPQCVTLRGDSTSRTYFVRRYEHADGRVAFIVDPNKQGMSASIKGPLRPGKYRAIGAWSSSGPVELQPVVRFVLTEGADWGDVVMTGTARSERNSIVQVTSFQKGTFETVRADASGKPTNYSATDTRERGWGRFTATKIERDDAPEFDPTLEKYTEQPLVLPGTYRLPMWDAAANSCSSGEATVTISQAGPSEGKGWGLELTIASDDDACTSGAGQACVNPPSLGATTVTVFPNNHGWKGLWSNAELAQTHVVVRFADDGKPRWVHRDASFSKATPQRFYNATFGDGTTVFYRFRKGIDPLNEAPVVVGCAAE